MRLQAGSKTKLFRENKHKLSTGGENRIEYSSKTEEKRAKGQETGKVLIGWGKYWEWSRANETEQS